MATETQKHETAKPVALLRSALIGLVSWLWPRYMLASEIKNAAIEYKKSLLFASTDHGKGLGNAKCVRQDRDWREYPIGTKAMAIGGGYWQKNERGWKWCTGSTFPIPGGDASGWVILPSS